MSGRRGRSFEVVVRSEAEYCRPGAIERLLEVVVCLCELVSWVHCTVDHYPSMVIQGLPVVGY